MPLPKKKNERQNVREDKFSRTNIILYLLGLLPTAWLGLLVAPAIGLGLPNLITNLAAVFGNPFHIVWCEDSLKTVLVFICAYVIGIIVYVSTARNYRRREEHGSAHWGNAGQVNKKYENKAKPEENKILTQKTKIGLDGHKHRRNLNVLVCGGSGAGKTRFYAKPNIMQANTSFVILDPKGENVRDTGSLLKAKGYDIKVLDLINMDKSYCYNPFVYLHSDNDIQKLVTNIFKNTTPKGSQSQDPFWDQAAMMLLLALVFYLHYEAPPEEQNFPMVMEMIRSGEVKEDDDGFMSPLDRLFSRLAERSPDHIALKYYRNYRSGSGKTLKSIQITLVARLEKFNLDSLAAITQSDEMELDRLGEEKIAIYAVTVGDVSLAEHDLKILLTSNSVTDFSKINVSRCGKNLFYMSLLKDMGYIRITDEGTGEFVFQNVTNLPETPIQARENMQYYVSGYIKGTIADQTVSCSVYYTDGSNTNFNISTDINCYVYFSGMTAKNKTVRGIKFGASRGIEIGTSFKEIQLEENSFTKYEPYNCKTVTANSDGSVEGLTSVSPNMTIFTDTEGVTINCTYNADTKKYIDNKIAELMQ